MKVCMSKRARLNSVEVTSWTKIWSVPKAGERAKIIRITKLEVFHTTSQSPCQLQLLMRRWTSTKAADRKLKCKARLGTFTSTTNMQIKNSQRITSERPNTPYLTSYSWPWHTSTWGSRTATFCSSWFWVAPMCRRCRRLRPSTPWCSYSALVCSGKQSKITGDTSRTRNRTNSASTYSMASPVTLFECRARISKLVTSCSSSRMILFRRIWWYSLRVRSKESVLLQLQVWMARKISKKEYKARIWNQFFPTKNTMFPKFSIRKDTSNASYQIKTCTRLMGSWSLTSSISRCAKNNSS